MSAVYPPGGGGGAPIWNRQGCSLEIFNVSLFPGKVGSSIFKAVGFYSQLPLLINENLAIERYGNLHISIVVNAG